jgi:hypothetical protein
MKLVHLALGTPGQSDTYDFCEPYLLCAMNPSAKNPHVSTKSMLLLHCGREIVESLSSSRFLPKLMFFHRLIEG